MSVKALYPGTFDPPTNGHLDLIHRGAKLFEHLTVAILNNPVKNPLFTVAERVEMLEEVTQPLSNVSVATFDGLMVEFARQQGATASLARHSRHLRLRIRVSDRADEPAAGAGNRDGFSAAGRALLVCQLADGEGSLQLWRRCNRPGAAQRAQASARTDEECLIARPGDSKSSTEPRGAAFRKY